MHRPLAAGASADGKRATFKATTGLGLGQEYRIRFEGITDLAGKALLIGFAAMGVATILFLIPFMLAALLLKPARGGGRPGDVSG